MGKNKEQGGCIRGPFKLRLNGRTVLELDDDGWVEACDNDGGSGMFAAVVTRGFESKNGGDGLLIVDVLGHIEPGEEKP